MGRCFRTGSSLAGRTRKGQPLGFGDLIALRPRQCQELLREGRCPDVVALLHGEIARAAQRAHLALGDAWALAVSACSSHTRPSWPWVPTCQYQLSAPVKRPRDSASPRAANQPSAARRLPCSPRAGPGEPAHRPIGRAAPRRQRARDTTGHATRESLVFPAGRHLLEAELAGRLQHAVAGLAAEAGFLVEAGYLSTSEASPFQGDERAPSRRAAAAAGRRQ